MPQVRFTLNGKQVSKEVPANRLLIDLLREDLKLTGTHLGCDTSQCGACMVLFNGDGVKSCALLALQCEGADIVSIEGIAGDEEMSPVQQAFNEAHGLQCGYCTPGMVVSITDLLQKNPSPTEAQVRDWLEGNICRCTGYQNIVKAAMIAAEKQQAA